MTKQRIIEMAQAAVLGTRPTDDQLSKMTEGIAETYLTLAFQQAIGVLYRSNNKTSELDPFTKTERNLKPVINELQLTYSPSHIKGNDGVRLVYPSGNPLENLWKDNQANKWISDELLGSIQNQNGTYSVDGSSIFLDSPKELAKAYDVKIIPEFWSLEDDDEVPMPRNFEKTILDIVKELALNTPPQDLINDSR